MCNISVSVDLDLLIIRIALAIVFIKAGFDNLYAGKENRINVYWNRKLCNFYFVKIFFRNSTHYFS